MKTIYYFLLLCVLCSNLAYSMENDWDLVVRSSPAKKDALILKGPNLECFNFKPPINIVDLEKWYHQRIQTEDQNKACPGFISWLKTRYPEDLEAHASELTNNKKEQENIEEKSQLLTKTNEKGEVYLTNYLGEVIDNYSGRYVIDRNGKIHITTPFVSELIRYHTSFLNGKPVICAGEIKISKGKITEIDNESGHYLPLPFHLHQGVSYLKSENVLDENCIVKCFWSHKNKLKEKSFDSLTSYCGWKKHQLREEQKKYFIAQEEEALRDLISYHTSLITSTIEPINHDIINRHKSYFYERLKNVDAEISNLLWNGYLRMISRFIYAFGWCKGGVQDRFDINCFLSHNFVGFKVNLEDVEETFDRFLRTSPETIILAAIFNENKVTEKLGTETEELQASFKDLPLGQSQNNVMSSQNIQEAILRFEEYCPYRMQALRKFKDSIGMRLLDAAEHRTEALEPRFIAELLYGNDSDAIKNSLAHFNHGYVGNSKVIKSSNLQVFSLPTTEIKEAKIVDSKTTQFNHSLVTDIECTDLDQNVFRVRLKYRHNGPLDYLLRSYPPSNTEDK